MEAKTSVTYELGGSFRSADGKKELRFTADDSFGSWWAIVRWNWYFGHWGALRMNARDLFGKVLRKKLLRR